MVALRLVATTTCSATHRTAARTALGDDAITVASFDFPESEILAEIHAQAIRAAGFTVDLRLDLGPRELVEPALERGLVEFVPEYAGSASRSRASGTPPPRPTRTHARRARRDHGVSGIAVLPSARADSQNGTAVSAATADEYHLRTISDLAPIAPSLTFGGPVECPDRPLCLPGLRSVYGLRFQRFVPLDASGPLTASALAGGQVDVALLFTTDGQIAADDFRLLADDRGLQPPTLRDLNAELYMGAGSPAEVPARWLRDHGLDSASG